VSDEISPFQPISRRSRLLPQIRCPVFVAASLARHLGLDLSTSPPRQALVAYPDKWGSSGVMTFIVNQQGHVYEKNLGTNTAKVAGGMTEYDPDPTWKRVEQQ
jgi:hypothetical protein